MVSRWKYTKWSWLRPVHSSLPYKVKEEPKETHSKTIGPTEQVSAVVVPKDLSSDLDELEAKVLSMMEISEARLPSNNNRRAHGCV